MDWSREFHIGDKIYIYNTLINVICSKNIVIVSNILWFLTIFLLSNFDQVGKSLFKNKTLKLLIHFLFNHITHEMGDSIYLKEAST